MDPIHIRIHLNENLYLRDPEQTQAGQTIIEQGLNLFLEIGFESVTFKKLGEYSGITEATIYKYFGNKHRLLQYYFDLYWVWMKELLKLRLSQTSDPEKKLLEHLQILCGHWPENVLGTQVNPKFLRQLVINEGFKSFLNKNVDDDNKLLLFKPYKDYCHYLAECISEIDAAYPFARSLSTTFIEMSHSMEFYKEHLPSMINIADKEHSTDVLSFLKSLTSSQLKK
jgi:AcrR family transcriptional regulator